MILPPSCCEILFMAAAIQMNLANEDRSFLGEESYVPGKRLTDKPTFICDPIDGTVNFVIPFPPITYVESMLMCRRFILSQTSVSLWLSVCTSLPLLVSFITHTPLICNLPFPGYLSLIHSNTHALGTRPLRTKVPTSVCPSARATPTTVRRLRRARFVFHARLTRRPLKVSQRLSWLSSGVATGRAITGPSSTKRSPSSPQDLRKVERWCILLGAWDLLH